MQKIRLHADNEKLAFDCKQYLNEIISNKLPEVYERIFYQNIHQDSYVNINSIQIDLGNLQISDFKSRFIQIVEDKIVSELKKQFEENPNNRISSVDDIVNFSSVTSASSLALIYFLENGIFPWWYEKQLRKSPAEILESLDREGQKEFFLKLSTKIKSLSIHEAEKTIRRFIDDKSSTDLELYINHLINLHFNSSIKININALLAEKSQLIKLFKIPTKIFLKQLFSFTILNVDETDLIKNFLIILKKSFPASSEEFKNREKEIEWFNLKEHIYEDLIKANEINLADVPEKENQQKTVDKHQPKESIYIENSGLILLHPFLTAYFKDLKIIDNQNRFISPVARLRATVLLCHLQSGSEKYNEWEMPLNKILCGLQHNDLIPKGIRLTKKEKEESKLLLQTVVSYWDALKGSSVEALQNTFFMREGKITQKDNSWLIQVERTGVDILLDRLPWSIGTIKLPWLKEIIHTEW
nr:contractile injection system tape measure protein [Pedobacter panaciterrae]